MSQTATLAVYNVVAVIRPDGRARRSNTLQHKVFKTINDAFSDRDEWRWVLVTKHGEKDVLTIDLWRTEMVDEFPYVEPTFVGEPMQTVDQAIGYVALHLC